MTRRATTALFAVLLAAGVVVATLVGVRDRNSDRPDGAAFNDYVTRYVGSYYDSAAPDAGLADRRWVTEHRDRVMEAGWAACRWLQVQPKAPPMAPTFEGSYGLYTMMERYGRTRDRPDAVLSDGGRSTITAGAWEYLCRAERKQRTAPVPEGD